MSIDEFELMPHPFGWKVEYWDGMARLTPREYIVKTKLILGNIYTISSDWIHPVDRRRKDQMIETFFETFHDSVEFCDWPKDKIAAHARKNIEDFFAEKRGRPLSVSVRALEPENKQLIGLALFLENKEGHAKLDLLFVKPAFQRQGIATKMISVAASSLFKEGIRELYSAYHVCNERSRDWQHQFGFIDIPDQFYCRMRYSWLRHEIWRLHQIGNCERLEELNREKDRWYDQLDEFSIGMFV